MSIKRAEVANTIAVILFALVSTCAVAIGDETSGDGVITDRTGNTLTVKTQNGPVTVVVSNDTKVQQYAGIFAKKDMPDSVLIPGLKLSFGGTRGADGAVTARSITFNSDDLALAQVIQAHISSVAQQSAANAAANKAAIAGVTVAAAQEIAANRAYILEVEQSTQKRFSELGEYVVGSEATVYFGVGDYNLAQADKQALAVLASQANAVGKGYLIQVAGFADSVGTAVSNDELSEERAEAVVAYLLQDCGVPVDRIAAPGALGENKPAASNETPSGRAENRRAEVKLLINKGIAASSR
jgi:OmpA-OmpF porin, OOP family